MQPRTKGEILRLARILVSKLKRVRGASAWLGEDVSELNDELDVIEKELAEMIDDYQAGMLTRHNYRGHK